MVCCFWRGRGALAAILAVSACCVVAAWRLYVIPGSTVPLSFSLFVKIEEVRSDSNVDGQLGAIKALPSSPTAGDAGLTAIDYNEHDVGHSASISPLSPQTAAEASNHQWSSVSGSPAVSTGGSASAPVASSEPALSPGDLLNACTTTFTDLVSAVASAAHAGRATLASNATAFPELGNSTCDWNSTYGGNATFSWNATADGNSTHGRNVSQPVYMFAVTAAAAEMAVNFLALAMRHDPAVLDGMVALSFSDEAAARLLEFNAVARSRGVGCVRVVDSRGDLPPALAGQADSHGVIQFNSDIFREVAFRRFVIAERAVREGFSVVVIDTDMILFKDVRALLVEAQCGRDAFVGACDKAGQQETLNTGLVLLSPVNHVGLVRWLDAFASRTDMILNEQLVLQRMAGTARHCLPPDVAAMYCHTGPNPARQHIYHYNCITASDIKRSKMWNDGFWLLPPASPTSTPFPPSPTPAPVSAARADAEATLLSRTAAVKPADAAPAPHLGRSQHSLLRVRTGRLHGR